MSNLVDLEMKSEMGKSRLKIYTLEYLGKQEKTKSKISRINEKIREYQNQIIDNITLLPTQPENSQKDVKLEIYRLTGELERVMIDEYFLNPSNPFNMGVILRMYWAIRTQVNENILF